MMSVTIAVVVLMCDSVFNHTVDTLQAPVFVNAPSTHIIYTAGDRVVLPCMAQGSPTPRYMYHNITHADWSPVSIQTQSPALRALRKRKPQETQALALASSQSWLPLLRPSIPIGWRLRLLREISTHANAHNAQSLNARNAHNASDYVWMETGLDTD